MTLKEMKNKAYQEYREAKKENKVFRNETKEDYLLSMVGEKSWEMDNEMAKNRLLKNLCWFISEQHLGKEFIEYLNDYEENDFNE